MIREGLWTRCFKVLGSVFPLSDIFGLVLMHAQGCTKTQLFPLIFYGSSKPYSFTLQPCKLNSIVSPPPASIKQVFFCLQRNSWERNGFIKMHGERTGRRLVGQQEIHTQSLQQTVNANSA
jgi:hypothetical protein